jgi:RNA polymerase sigma-70 factor (ECF subfamily)
VQLHQYGEDLQARREAHLLWQAVQQLNQKGQEVVYLRYFLEMSEAETAETLDIPPGTVKSRLHRALKQLRGVIERKFPELGDVQ